MRKNFKTLAGMAICILGALAASSCSKDEFFGLEDSEVLDYSTKYEIATSQEYANYAIACINIAETMMQPVDTTDMKIQGVVNGKPIYYKDNTSSVMELLDILKKAYPILNNADKIDLDDILSIALSKNEALKEYESKQNLMTKYEYPNTWEANQFVNTIGISYYGWYFDPYSHYLSAVNNVIWGCSENTYYVNGGGLIFSDNSGVSMIGYGGGECWPTEINSISPHAEADFIVAPSAYLPTLEIWDLVCEFGPGYYNGGRVHYVFDHEMHYRTFLY